MNPRDFWSHLKNFQKIEKLSKIPIRSEGVSKGRKEAPQRYSFQKVIKDNFKTLVRNYTKIIFISKYEGKDKIVVPMFCRLFLRIYRIRRRLRKDPNKTKLKFPWDLNEIRYIAKNPLKRACETSNYFKEPIHKESDSKIPQS